MIELFYRHKFDMINLERFENYYLTSFEII